MLRDIQQLYTDGSSIGNPGPGGYAAISCYQGEKKELVGGFTFTTNNRMELLAVIVGLEALKKPQTHMHVYSDSRYVVDAINKRWLWDWRKKRFLKVKNPDLWRRFWNIYQQHHGHVKFIWVQGHVGHVMNERCDQLAKRAALEGPWSIDSEYVAATKKG